jgi:hypothetical protein
MWEPGHLAHGFYFHAAHSEHLGNAGCAVLRLAKTRLQNAIDGTWRWRMRGVFGAAFTLIRSAIAFGVEIDFAELAERTGGDGGIRTLDRALQPYNGLANRRLQPLGHISGRADMPDTGASRKRPIWGRRITPAFNRYGPEPRRSIGPYKVSFEASFKVSFKVYWATAGPEVEI